MPAEPDDNSVPNWTDPPPERRETAILSSKNRRRNNPELSEGTTTLRNQQELLLVVRGMVERVVIPGGSSIILGRADLNARYHPDVDLTPYGALDRGVSRGHAKLHIDEENLYVTDLGSTNGTFLAGKRLEPDEPTLLRKGDELLLGRLAVQILFS
jgi:pSer/pThr/pTyr-binding forkhead associated (FHA) protein